MYEERTSSGAGGGCRKDEVRPFVVVFALCFLQCFDTVGWISVVSKTLCHLLPKVVYGNRWKKKAAKEPANLGSPGRSVDRHRVTVCVLRVPLNTIQLTILFVFCCVMVVMVCLLLVGQEKSLEGYRLYAAMYEFTARSNDELSLNAGDLVWVCTVLL